MVRILQRQNFLILSLARQSKAKCVPCLGFYPIYLLLQPQSLQISVSVWRAYPSTALVHLCKIKPLRHFNGEMQSFCRTCFRQSSDNTSLVSLDFENCKPQLIFCIPEMDLRALPDAKLCKDCVAALDVTYKYKIKCRKVEDEINKRLFKVTGPITVKQETSNYTVCRTCLTDVTTDKSLKLLYKSKLMLCVPEMDLQFASDINLCKNCQMVLDTIYIFKTRCLDVEKNIKDYLKLHDVVDLKDLPIWCNTFIKNEVISDLKSFTIKQETVDIEDDDEITEDLTDQSTRIKFDSVKIEELNTCECTKEIPKYQKCKGKNIKRPSNTTKTVYKCSKCKYSSKQKSNFDKHIRIHTGEKPFKCIHCEYEAAQKSHLIRHIRSHTNEKPFKCSYCEYSYARKCNLKEHIRTHTGEKPFKCSQCAYSTPRRLLLKIHIRKHTGAKPFNCSHCEYSTIEKTSLDNHIRTHTGEKQFKCSWCEYSAAQRSCLKEHMCLHTGVKPFNCSYCEYGATRKSTLVKHIRTHTGEKPFKCLSCDYSAARKSRLIDHIRTHTGEKPYKCSLCEYSFARKSRLNDHIRTHTGKSHFRPSCAIQV